MYDNINNNNNISEIEPSSYIRRNIYHLNVPLFVLDVIRLFQDHPKYNKGLKENHIAAILEKESYACGDIESQVKMALRDLTSTGFVRYVNHGYRTLGPYAKLALARTSRQYNIAWDHLNKAHKISSSS